jgi:ABC-type transporter Mla subunit MlaD
MKKGTRDSVLGLVFFGGLGLLLWATQHLSDISFGTRQMITVEFANARGLREGEPVFVLGTQTGKVTSVHINQKTDPYTVTAIIQLDSHTPLELKDDTQIKVVDASMLGGKRVEITPGVKGQYIPDHRFAGEAPLGPLDALGDMVAGDENKDNLAGALKGIREFMDKLNDGKGSLARFITDDTLIKDAEAMIKSLRQSAEELEKKQSLLGRLIYDDELGRKTNEIISDLEKTTKKLTGTESTLGRLINDDALGKKIDNIVTDVEQVTTKLTGTESTLGRLINDDELGKKIDTIVANFEKTTNSLNDKDSGLIGALINDEELLADGRKIIADLADITDKINTGQGALGRLINDEDMGRRLDSMIRQITRAIEDAREAAPIGTFFQVFSGSF